MFQAHVEYETTKRHYAHVDCPGHADYVKVSFENKWVFFKKKKKKSISWYIVHLICLITLPRPKTDQIQNQWSPESRSFIWRVIDM